MQITYPKLPDSGYINKKNMSFHNFFSSGHFKVYLVLLASLTSACAQIEPTPVTEEDIKLAEIKLSGADIGWYAARFSLPRDKGSEPQWYLGTLLAGEVVSPLLDQYGQQIVNWRVHRRAVDDQVGHVFSFIFYSSEAGAKLIYQSIKNNQLLAELLEKQRVLKVSYEPLAINADALISDTSDPGWPEEMRQTWPLFIMGASQMWLAQVKIFKAETTEKQAVEHRYQKIQGKMSELWQQQGQHALIHHLGALYAYQPVLTRF